MLPRMGESAERWATFDCYGTLIDWNAGIGRELERLFGPGRGGELLHTYHELEPQIQREEPGRSYREVMSVALARLGAPADERDALARSLPEWEPFPEVPPALEELRRRGWRLAVLSNSDRDLIAASQRRLVVPFDHVVVAEDVRSYKPGHAHWLRFRADTGADPGRHVHVAASRFHDVAAARELAIPCIWINRLGEAPDPVPARELPDLTCLADTLDELVSA